jgi:hypothetical protein
MTLRELHERIGKQVRAAGDNPALNRRLDLPLYVQINRRHSGRGPGIRDHYAPVILVSGIGLRFDDDEGKSTIGTIIMVNESQIIRPRSAARRRRPIT